jgi:peroxiredoxin
MTLNKYKICDFGWKARDFTLKGVDGKTYSLADVRGPKGLLVVFICNHCPYVGVILGGKLNVGGRVPSSRVGWCRPDRRAPRRLVPVNVGRSASRSLP